MFVSSKIAYKPFNQAVFDECDPVSRSKVIEWLKRVHHLDAIGNPNMFGVDLVVFDRFVPKWYVEVEMRLWKENLHHCPYSTIHVPVRKKKLFNNDLPTYMCVVNHYQKYAYWIDVERIMKSPVIEVKNRAVAKDEYFYDVPTDAWRLFELDELW